MGNGHNYNVVILRIGARSLDMLIYLLFSGVMLQVSALVIGIVGSMLEAGPIMRVMQILAVIILIILPLIILFVVVPKKTDGTTLGKAIFGIRMISSNDNKLGYWRYFRRELHVILLSFIPMINLI